MSQIILVTGASRGIGKGLVTHYLAQPDTTLIATVRDTISPKATDLNTLPKGPGSRLIIVALSADSPTDASEAATTLKTQHGITHIDVAIACAGICDHWGPMSEASDADVLLHFEVNALGPLRLFRAVAPLLKEAAKPKFVFISTLLASIGGIGVMDTLTGPYGMSKAAGNYLVRKIHDENPHLATLCVDPGLVQTDLGDRAAQAYGLERAPVTLDESVSGITAQIKKLEKSTTSGSFVNTRGEINAW
ncbi:putative NADP(+)-dependent dehydrogenase [Aspergillus insuetus]